MAQDAHLAEPDWIRHRIERLRALRDAVYDRQTLHAINELIDEAEERLHSLEAVKRASPRRTRRKQSPASNGN